MTVLIASCIRQKPEILREFLESLDKLVKPEYEYFFILSDLEDKSKELFDSWNQDKPVETLTMDFDIPYVTDEDTHHWNTELVSNVMEMKNVILERATEYDHLLFVDSDTYLHPETLTQLLSRGKDIITEISWTKWYADDDRILPNAWFYQKYGFPSDGLKRLRNKPLVKVGGFGGLYLISKKALEAGVSFGRVEGKPDDWGEDRHFAVRAQTLGLELWCDTVLPSFHIYRISDLPKLREWKRHLADRGFEVVDCRWATRSELESPEFKMVIKEIESFAPVYPRWSRDWEYPYAYLNSGLKENMVILDAGCGDSPLKLFLADKCEVHCLDQREVKVPENITFKQGDIIEIPYPDNYFDRTFCISVLEHAKEKPIRYIEEMLRTLKIGGTLHLTVDVNWEAETPWKFKPSELNDLCQELKIEPPYQPDDLLRSEDHPEGKAVGEGLSVIGFTFQKTANIGQMQGEKHSEASKAESMVLVAVPHTGVLRAELVAYLLNVVARNAGNKKFRISVDLSWGMPVDSNRNSIAKKLLGTDNEWLLTIDSDIEPPPMVLEELLSHGKKVVGAVCWSSMGGEEGGRWERFGIPYPVIMSKNPKGGWNVDREAASSEGRLVECDAGSTACLLLHREVLEAIEPPWFRLQYDEDGLCEAGEDFTFFDKVKAKGYEVYVDLSLQCAHYKTVDIKRLNDLLAETGRKINA